MDVSKAVKFVDGTDDLIEGWAAPFDGPLPGGKDFDKENFSSRTDFALNWFESRPVLFHHGFDAETGITPVGRVKSHDLKANGLWAQAQLDKSNAYWEEISHLIAEGKLFFSSGALGHLTKKSADGEILVWPWVELSLTPTPANPYATVTASQAAKHFKAAGIDTADLQALSAAPETKAEEAATPTASDTTASVVAEAVAPAASEVEATEPAVTEIPTVDQPVTEQAPAAVAAVDLNTNPDATANTAIKALETQVAALVAKLNDEPAVKAGGIALPAIHLKADTSEEVKAFELWIRTGIETPALKAALNVTTPSTGGYAVPVQYSNELVVPLTNLSYLRRAGARIVNFSGTEAVHVPSLTFTSAAILTAEANAYSEVEPTMGEVVFVPYKYTRIAKASEELAADSRFDLWGQILMPDFAQAFAQSENTAFTSGTGSSQPQGLVYGTSTGITTASASAITADEVIQTFFALDYKYRDNAKWMMADSTVSYVRRLKDGQGNYLWNPGLNGSTSGELLGKPIVTNNSMDAIAASKDVALFADFSYFWIGNWPGLSMQRLNELYAASGQIGWRAFSRFDSHLMLAAAATKLTTHS